MDLADGKVLGSAEFKGEVAGLGFAGRDRVFVRSPVSVTILDTAAGKTIQTVEFGSADAAKYRWQHSSSGPATACTPPMRPRARWP